MTGKACDSTNLSLSTGEACDSAHSCDSTNPCCINFKACQIYLHIWILRHVCLAPTSNSCLLRLCACVLVCYGICACMCICAAVYCTQTQALLFLSHLFCETRLMIVCSYVLLHLALPSSSTLSSTSSDSMLLLLLYLALMLLPAPLPCPLPLLCHILD